MMTASPKTPLPALPPGATLGIIAPAGPVAPERLQAVAPWLEARGYQGKIFPGCRERQGYLAGSDETRLQDLHAAFADPAVAAILCLRGGYGCARIIDRIDYGLIAAHPKPFIGYSDLTALHAAFNRRSGLVTIHGPMAASDLVPAEESASADALFAFLTQPPRSGDGLPSAHALLRTVLPGKARGRLTGGNLSIICSLVGTPWALDCRDTILFLEDIGEKAYRVDRMLTHLRLAGALEGVRGFVIGDFGDDPDNLSVVLERLLPLGKPLLAGWPAGHCPLNLPLPLGAQVVLDADRQVLLMA